MNQQFCLSSKEAARQRQYNTRCDGHSVSGIDGSLLVNYIIEDN